MSKATKNDTAKAPLSLINPVFTEEVARVLAFGEAKYGKNNWRGLQVERLLDAVKRHVLEIEKGNDYDEETGLPHAAHAASGLMLVEWIRTHRPEQDDRRWPAVPLLRPDSAGRVHTEPRGEVGLGVQEVHQTPAEEQKEARSYSQGTIADVQRSITEWADRTFPDRTIEEAVKKLKKETAELEASGHTDAGEFADVVILIMDIMYLQGIDVRRAVANKMAINERRVWQRLEDGTHQHVVDGGRTHSVHPVLLNVDRAQIASLAPRHVDIESEDGCHICPVCGQRFGLYSSYSDHYIKTHGAKNA